MVMGGVDFLIGWLKVKLEDDGRILKEGVVVWI